MTRGSRASVPRRRMQAGVMWKEVGLPGRATLETEDGDASEWDCYVYLGKTFLMGLALANCSGSLLVRS